MLLMIFYVYQTIAKAMAQCMDYVNFERKGVIMMILMILAVYCMCICIYVFLRPLPYI